MGRLGAGALMEVLLVPVGGLGLLLVVAGAFKLHDPAPTAGALRAVGLPSSLGVARLLGAGELAIGGWVALLGGRAAVGLLAATYLAFTAFVAVALRRHTPLQGCGCFGHLEVEPAPLHLGVNLLAAATAVAASVTGTRGAIDAIADHPAAGLAATGLAALVAFLLVGILTALSEARLAGRPRREILDA